MTDTPSIQFLCPPELEGRIPAPERAGKSMPDWFRALPREMGMADEHGLPGLTVRACLPVADAMSLGWTLPLPVDVTAATDPATGALRFHWAADAPWAPLGTHHPGQIGADAPPGAGNPFSGFSPMKFMNPWRVVLPAGWSAMFLHPLNHFELPFRTFGGAVDCDALDVAVNMPFLWTAGEAHLPAGTPIAQVVPYDRAAMRLPATARAETGDEAKRREAIYTRKHSEVSVYAREWRRRHERRHDLPD